MGSGIPLGWHRRHAITLVGQLPDQPEDALLVLQAAKEVVEKFLMGHPDEKPEAASNVIPFNSG